jgi:transcriptional regulator with XRE-family HTH domain
MALWISNYGISETGTGTLSNTVSSDLWHKLSNREYRASFAALQLKRGVPFQIRAILKKRGWTQEKLAEQAELTQGVISRAQDPDYGNLTINTISRLAAGFDVAFVGEFVPFSRLVDWFQNLSEDSGEIESFNREYAQLSKLKFSRRRKRRSLKTAKESVIAEPAQRSLFPESTTTKLPQGRESTVQREKKVVPFRRTTYFESHTAIGGTNESEQYLKATGS